MKNKLLWNGLVIRPGMYLYIVQMNDADGFDVEAARMNRKVGVIKSIDDASQIHGTWGGLAVIPDIDRFIVADSLKELEETIGNKYE